MSNSPYNDPNYVNPNMIPPQRKGFNPLYLIIIVVVCLSVPCCGILAGLMLPAIQQARLAARKMTQSNQMRQVGLALLEYEQVYRAFPPAYTVDSDGRPLHSWRTLILPFMEQASLYQKIDLNKPWDDPANAAARETVVSIYNDPNSGGPSNLTSLAAIVSDQSIFPGSEQISFRDISDGSSNTILISEVTREQGIQWMEPRDLSNQEFIHLAAEPRGLSTYFDGFHVVMADGSIRFIVSSVDIVALQSMVTRDGSETITSLSE